MGLRKSRNLLPGMLLAGAILFLMGAQTTGSDRAAAVNETVTVTGERAVITLNGTRKWRLGKIQRPATTISGGISISQRHRAVTYYETPTYRLDQMETVTVHTSIPAPQQSNIEMRVITSNVSDFGDGSGNYWRLDEATYLLSDGHQTMEVPQLDGTYHRVFFALNRTSDTIPTPRVRSLQFTGLAPENGPVVPGADGRNP